jgi:hypothetical protein
VARGKGREIKNSIVAASKNSKKFLLIWLLPDK